MTNEPVRLWTIWSCLLTQSLISAVMSIGACADMCSVITARGGSFHRLLVIPFWPVICINVTVLLILAFWFSSSFTGIHFCGGGVQTVSERSSNCWIYQVNKESWIVPLLLSHLFWKKKKRRLMQILSCMFLRGLVSMQTACTHQFIRPKKNIALFAIG